MDAPETATLTVPARREAFAALSAWLEARLAPLNPSPKARRQLLVAADEILTNVATYAYPPDAPGELQVTLRHADGTLSLTFADRGVPYDPLSAPPPDLSLPLAERAPTLTRPARPTRRPDAPTADSRLTGVMASETEGAPGVTRTPQGILPLTKILF